MPMPLGLVSAPGTPIRLNEKMWFGITGKGCPMYNQHLDYVLIPDVRDDGAFEEWFESSYGE